MGQQRKKKHQNNNKKQAKLTKNSTPNPLKKITFRCQRPLTPAPSRQPNDAHNTPKKLNKHTKPATRPSQHKTLTNTPNWGLQMFGYLPLGI